MAPADWYPDPTDPSRLRYWDGTAWTAHVAPVLPQPDLRELSLRRIGGRVVVPSAALAAGVAPERCVLHRSPGTPTQVQFVSRTPAWVWITILVGVIVPIIISVVLRRTVTANAWPICERCRAERRRNLVLVGVSLAAWIPGFALYSMLPRTGDGASLLLLLIVCLAPLIAALWFADRARLARGIRGEVAADGLTVSFPAGVFPPPAAPAAAAASPFWATRS